MYNEHPMLETFFSKNDDSAYVKLKKEKIKSFSHAFD